MSTDAIIILTFLALDFGAVLCALFYLAERREEAEATDLRRREARRPHER